MTLSEKIVYCRKKAGLSQEELAERVGVSRQAVSKWELADAVPEIGKLLLLAKIFGVTTDWLLSEDDPEPEPAPGPEPERTAAPAVTWVDSVPGVIGQLLRRYGWLFGVYMAVGGGLFTAMGLVMRAMFGAFADTAGELVAAPFGGMGAIWTDEAGNILGRSTSASPAGNILSGFVIGLGVVLLIAGIVIAVTLHPKKPE